MGSDQGSVWNSTVYLSRKMQVFEDDTYCSRYHCLTIDYIVPLVYDLVCRSGTVTTAHIHRRESMPRAVSYLDVAPY
jgi:hypothetical protein